MEVRRTAVVKLAVSDEQRDALHRTAEQYLYCANRTSEFCWDDASCTNCKTNKRQVRDALYADLREETDLQAQLVQAAIRRGVEAVKGVVERWKKGQRVSCPTFTAETMDYDTRSATFYRTKASLSTVDGRVECQFVLPSDSPTPYKRYVLPEEYEFRESTLRYDAVTDEIYLNISTRRYESDRSEVSEDTEHQMVLGIDLGVNSLAVASTGTFWQGDDYDHWIREFEKRRGEMQQRGTQAAHNALLRLGKREQAWRKQYVHTVANEIVSEAVEHDCDVIVFEELDGIRERLPQAKWHHVGRSGVSTSMSSTRPRNAVSKRSRLRRTTRPNAALGWTVGSPTSATAMANTFTARSAATRSTRTTTRQRISGYDTPESGTTDSVPRPSRGAETHK